MNTTQLIKKATEIMDGVRRTESILSQALDHIDEGMIRDAREDLWNAFLRLAPLPPKIGSTVDLCETYISPFSNAEKIDTGFAVTNPVCRYETPHIFFFNIPTKPYLRDQKNGRYYAELLGVAVEKSVVAAVDYRDHRFQKIYAIFVNHVSANNNLPQPYYDNDNLLIKRILDSIISFVAIDDAICYCSNLYTYTRDNKDEFSIFIVEEGHLIDWAEAHRDINLAAEIVGRHR